jgi:hypothetical protein
MAFHFLFRFKKVTSEKTMDVPTPSECLIA